MTYQQPQQQVIYQQIVKPPSNGMAITAMILGIVALVTGIWTLIPIVGLMFAFLSFIPALLAIIFGHVGQKKAALSGGVGNGNATCGLIMGYVTLGIIVLTTIFWIVALAATSTGS